MTDEAKPAAWMYHSPFGTELCKFRWGTDEGISSDNWIGWTETPLYAQPTPPADSAMVEAMAVLDVVCDALFPGGGKQDRQAAATVIASHTAAKDAQLAELRAEIEVLRGECGWIVGNGDGTAWRYWVDGMPNWTPNRDEATRFVRRCDAEDEDAWRVVRFVDARAAGGDAS